MATSEVKLLGVPPSPYVNRVQIALNLKSIPYEFIKEDLYAKSDLLLNMNPIYKKVPVLIHDGKPICESLYIVEYIDEVWKDSSSSLLPSDPYDRATARFWAAYVDIKWFPLMGELRHVKEEAEKTELVAKIVEGLVLLEEAFIKCCKDEAEGYFGGESIGYVDLILGSYLGWVKAGEIYANVKVFDENKTPKLVKWGQRFLLNDAVKGIVPEPQELVEFLRILHG